MMNTKSKEQEKTCAREINRRTFLSGCACCAVGGCLSVPGRSHADQSSGSRPKIQLVFCEANNKRPIWPNIGYDFDMRRQQIIKLLTGNCRDLHFIPVQTVDNSKQVAGILNGEAEVDGYVVCIQGLGWRNDIHRLCTTGKPTLLVDNLFGGSGKFLREINRIMQSGKPVDWVSSSNDEDIVASARHLGLLKQGKTAADIASMFRATRRERTPTDADWKCKEDTVPSVDFEDALKQMKKIKILVVNRGKAGRTTQGVGGIQFAHVSFDELAGAYKQADKKKAGGIAASWIDGADKVVDVNRSEIEKSAAMYLGMKSLLAKHEARGISINCLGGFYGGHLKAYPCLGFTELNNEGLVGGCEADQRSALTMATMGVLTGRPGYISDPVIDTSRNVIIYAHCVAPTKPFGPGGNSNPYQILTHSEDRKGASMRSLLPAGYMTTSLEIDTDSRQVIMHQAKSIGNNPSDMACRTKLECVVKGDIEKMTENWSTGWHRVTFYGDLKEQVTELCDRLKLKLIKEA